MVTRNTFFQLGYSPNFIAQVKCSYKYLFSVPLHEDCYNVRQADSLARLPHGWEWLLLSCHPAAHFNSLHGIEPIYFSADKSSFFTVRGLGVCPKFHNFVRGSPINFEIFGCVTAANLHCSGALARLRRGGCNKIVKI